MFQIKIKFKFQKYCTLAVKTVGVGVHESKLATVLSTTSLMGPLIDFYILSHTRYHLLC